MEILRQDVSIVLTVYAVDPDPMSQLFEVTKRDVIQVRHRHLLVGFEKFLMQAWEVCSSCLAHC